MLQTGIYYFIACLLQVCAAQSSTASATSSGSSNSGSGSKGHSLPIEIVGNKFFFSNGTQFYIKGIAYQADTANSTSDETINDPLADYETCSRDLPYLVDLHTNTIRVYAVNTTLDHSKCMQLLDENGIYVIADLSEPGLSVNRDSPDWTLKLYERYTAVVDVLADYPNVLGFFAGNEVTNNASNTDASPFVKAALRDTKAYIKEKGYRKIPVGYSSNDDGDTRVAIANYFACGDDDEKADFYGINMYEWCGESTFKESGFADRTKEFSNLSIPLFFSEYGCNEVSPRKFTEVGTLYGNDMTDIWSGGIVYMYFQEDNNYGLVEIKDGEVSTLSDFNYLKSELATVSPTLVNKDSYSATSTSLFCPPTNSNWMAAKELPPRPRSDVCDCIKDSVKCTLADSVQEKDYGELFGYLCDKIDCSEIAANGTTGEYGPFAYCDSGTKLSYLLNQYYQKNGQSSSACDFSGAASVRATSAPSSCSAILASASSDGSGSRSGSSGNASNSAGRSQGSSTSKAAAAAIAPITNPGLILGGTIFTFIFSGFSMLLV